jgi:hypothetical protein
VQRFGSKRGLLLAFASTGAGGMGEEFDRIRKKQRSAVAAVYALADCMAGMAVTPETLSNSLAFLQMDLVDPEFHKHALAHSRATHVEMTRLLDEAVAAGELKPCDTRRLARAVQALMGGSLLQWAIERDGPRPPGCATTSKSCSTRCCARAADGDEQRTRRGDDNRSRR